MIKHSLSLLDDIEILVFANETSRDLAVSLLAERGVTQIRAMPVEQRFHHRGDLSEVVRAIEAVKQSLACPS
jgi:hypothetical protein